MITQQHEHSTETKLTFNIWFKLTLVENVHQNQTVICEIRQ